MGPVIHAEGDVVLCPRCGCALKYHEAFRVYARMSTDDWFALSRSMQHDLIQARRELALTHVMTDDWRFER